MSTLQKQLKVWTTRPGELLREVVGQGDQGQPEADELVKHGSFNGLFVVFTYLSEVQFHALEDAVRRMGLKYDASQQSDDTHYDIRCYPKGTYPKGTEGNAYERGMHDAEIDLWHFRSVQGSSPQEAIMKRATRMRKVLDQFNAVPDERSQEEREAIAHSEGYLERVRQEFPLL